MENPGAQGVHPVNQPPQQPPANPHPAPPEHHRSGGHNRKKTGLFAVLAAVVLMLAVGVTVYLGQQQQDTRQRASESVCQLKNVDVILVIDSSNSMDDGKLGQAKNAAGRFIDLVLAGDDTENRIGIAHFDNNGGLNRGLTNDKQELKATVNKLSRPGNGKGGTCLECAIDKRGDGDVRSAFAKADNKGNNRVVIILTDGKINRYMQQDGDIKGSTGAGDERQARDQAQRAINGVRNDFNVTFGVIQYGGSANDGWLINDIAKSQENYLKETKDGNLAQMYERFADKLLGGTLTAKVYDDVNRNGSREETEGPLPGVNVELWLTGSDEASRSATTDENGEATFTNVCDDPQKLTVIPLEGYEPSPAGSNVKDVQVPEGETVIEEFGLKKIINATTLVCAPEEIALSVNNQTITATLRDKDGAPLSGQQITWGSPDGGIEFIEPGSSQAVGGPASRTDVAGVNTFLENASRAVVKPVYAACKGNRDCRGGDFCVQKKCVECRNPGSKNDCKGGRVCNRNHRCVLDAQSGPAATATPTPTTVPGAPTATPTPSPVPGSATATPTPTPTPEPSGIASTTNASGVASISFKYTTPPPPSGVIDTVIHATYPGQDVYSASTCSVVARYETPAAQVELNADPLFVEQGGSSTLTWTTENVTSCTASEAWSGNKNPAGGTESTGPLTESKTYTITCIGPSGTVADAVTVDVGEAPGLGIDVTVLMHGIGASGDNANPEPEQCKRNSNASGSANTDLSGCLSNQNPLTSDRPFVLEILDTSNTVAATGTGTLTYDPAQGFFTGTANLNSEITPGNYSMRISSEKYLTRAYPGVVRINEDQNSLRPISMVVGDAYTGDDSKNQLDIRDYNALYGCFSETAPPRDCDFIPNQQFLTDLNDDGAVNGDDYNLFIRELSVQYGDNFSF